MKFSDLNIDNKITKALEEIEFVEMTDVQKNTIPVALDGKDIIAQSMTGSGKTAAFGVPISEKIEHGKGIQAVIIGPTRELVNQVSDEMVKFNKYKQLSIVSVFGGVSIEPQIRNLRHADIVVGTPGRMLDHLQRRTMKLDKVKISVLDEADRMLDMGFIDDIKKILLQTPKNRQTLLFSATMPDEVVGIAKRFMKDPVNIKGRSHISPHLLEHFYYDTKQEEKLSLVEYIVREEKPNLAIIFCATRDITDFVARHLESSGMEAKAIHGGMKQESRMNVLRGFHKGRPHILVATDVAARGLDIKDVSHIINYDIPKTVDDYTHRIGRTARFGKKGKTISLLSRQDHDAFKKIIRRMDVKRAEISRDFHPQKIYFRSRGGDRRPRFDRGRRSPGKRRFARRR